MWANFMVVVFCIILSVLAQDNNAQNVADLEEATSPLAELKIFTVATAKTDGFKRFIRSAKQFNLDIEVLAMGQKWQGGDTRYYSGGGQKIRYYREAISPYKEKKNVIVMFADAYDVIFNADASEIISRFLSFNAKVLFSAEKFCWPDRSLAVKYPLVKVGKRYLNSGLFMGYASYVYGILTYNMDIRDEDDDQLYFTNIFIDNDLRDKYHIRLDTTGRIFQNLNGAEEDVDIDMSSGRAEVVNMAYSTSPCIIHGNGPSKKNLNYLGNYIANSWNEQNGCISCREEIKSLSGVNTRELPLVVVAIFVTEPTPFFAEFFEHVAQLSYPKHRIVLFLYSNVPYHGDEISKWLQTNEVDYKDSYTVFPDDSVDERTARKGAIDFCLQKTCDYLFVLDSEAHLDNKDTLTILIEQNREIQAPFLSRPGKLWSNFWGALSENGFYGRSDDYNDIVTLKRRGVWNVPYIRTAYLISAERLPHIKDAYSHNTNIDSDMSFCAFLRSEGYFLFVNNLHDFGHLIDVGTFDTTKKYPDLFQIFENEEDWNKRYLHENYTKQLSEGFVLDQPCPDVYDFPFFTVRYCLEMIDEVEHFGKWSSGNNQDERLEGGYENVPTRDIHMNQIGYERHWLYLLDTYARPIQEKVFSGYFQKPIYSSMMFVVRYKPTEQSFLRPHHDASTYSVDISLNRGGIDFQGGGVRFVRYNCTVLDHKQGWSLIFPGRLTHLHEGLETTEGTRYIAVSFINP